MCNYVCLCECACVCVAVNIDGCYIWIVNDLTDWNTFFFKVHFLLFYIGIVFVSRGVCLCVAVNSHDCYIWICK